MEKRINKKVSEYISTYKNNSKFAKIIECNTNIVKTKQITNEQAKQIANEQANQSINNLNNQALINTQPINIYETLFKNNEEFLSFDKKFIYNLVKINETEEIFSIKHLIDNGLISKIKVGNHFT